jgi:Ser/Thr protein kinase RdoA (MazF antagonist)
MQDFFKLDEDFDSIIRNVLSEKGITKIDDIQMITTGWTNIVFKAYSEEGNYYFRFPRDDFWERTIVKDYEFCKYINGKTSFETCKLELHYDKERPFSVHKEIPGTPIAHVMNELSKEEVEKVSAQIAKFMHELHNLKYDKSEIFNITANIGLDLNDFIEELLRVHVSEEDYEFWKIDDLIDKSSNDECLVHGDLNSSNIILDANNNVKAIIDFGFGGFGNKYNDIARIIGRCPETFKESITRNYETLEGKELNKEELDREIKVWSNIDGGYINYMRKIGIYGD